jgi:hypothetical protein
LVAHPEIGLPNFGLGGPKWGWLQVPRDVDRRNPSVPRAVLRFAGLAIRQVSSGSPTNHPDNLVEKPQRATCPGLRSRDSGREKTGARKPGFAAGGRQALVEAAVPGSSLRWIRLTQRSIRACASSNLRSSPHCCGGGPCASVPPGLCRPRRAAESDTWLAAHSGMRGLASSDVRSLPPGEVARPGGGKQSVLPFCLLCDPSVGQNA